MSFDPKSSMSLPFSEMNWTTMMLTFTILFTPIWVKPNRMMTSFMSMMLNMSKQFEISLKTKKDGSKMIFFTLFWFIFTTNLMGLIPNLFTSTSHIMLNLVISVPLWMGFLMYGWTSYTNKMFVHLVPSGTPAALISFMVLIEMISTIIRPFTLSIRLMANMVSGHLLMTLAGNTFTKVYLPITFVFIMLSQTLLFSLELGVAMIQAYVFCMLMTLYSDESDYK